MVDPADVNLTDINRLMAQGSVIPSGCSGDPDMDCVVGSNMQEVMDEIFCKAKKQHEAYFGGITISDVLGQIKECEQC